MDQNALKLVLDIAPPVQFLDIGLEAIYKANDYKNALLGRTSDHRQEYFGTLSYGDPKAFRVMLFGDVEWSEYGSYHRLPERAERIPGLHREPPVSAGDLPVPSSPGFFGKGLAGGQARSFSEPAPDLIQIRKSGDCP